MKSKQELLNMVEEYNVLLNKVKTPREEFIIELYHFDWYYSYSDDPNIYRNAVSRMSQLLEQAKEYELERVFKYNNEERDVWFGEQEVIKFRKRIFELQRDKDVKFLIKGNDYEDLISMKEEINKFLELFNKLPEYRNGYFVHTPKTPNNLREYFTRTDYSGITLPDTLQKEFTEYFKDSSDLIRAINLSCDNHYSFNVGNSGVRFSFDTIPETDSVVLEVGCYPRAYRFII